VGDAVLAEKVEPLLGPDAVYLGEVSHERKLELLAGASALLFPIRGTSRSAWS